MGHVRRLLVLSLIFSGLPTTAAIAAARGTQPVVVETASGRVFSGHVDGRTTERTLVLRSGTSGMYLVRPIQWSHVAWVEIGGKTLEPAEAFAHFARERHAVADQGSSQRGTDASTSKLPGPSDAMDDEAVGAGNSASGAVVKSLAIEATVARWQSGAENDGVLLRVYPLDGQGEVVPVNGTLEVDVIGERGAGQSTGEPFPHLIHSTVQVRPQDFGPNGATYRVAFQAWHPEFDLRLGSTGTVHARLSVPGHGVFDDTASMVWLRPLSTSRDRLQQETGGRFFPEERTNRGMNDSGFPH